MNDSDAQRSNDVVPCPIICIHTGPCKENSSTNMADIVKMSNVYSLGLQ